jgi:hypothetical protein
LPAAPHGGEDQVVVPAFGVPGAAWVPGGVVGDEKQAPTFQASCGTTRFLPVFV